MSDACPKARMATPSTKDARLSSVKNLEELGLDVTDTTLATDLVGQGSTPFVM
jgi:hypothetical protein